MSLLFSLLTMPGQAASLSIGERLKTFAQLDSADLEQAVTIRWNEYAIPFIDAGTDNDLAYSIGLVQAHLRGEVLAVARLLAQGRSSESFGYVANDADRFIRVIDPYHTSEAIYRQMPAPSRLWLQKYVQGLNAYFAQVYEPNPPPEWGLINLRMRADFVRRVTALATADYPFGHGSPQEQSPELKTIMADASPRGFLNRPGTIEPFTPQDILAIGRISGIDVNWFGAFQIIAQGNALQRATDANDVAAQERIAREWRRLAGGSGNFLSEEGGVFRALLGSTRAGSNAWAVSPARTRNGGVLLANDPHLGYHHPNIWFAIGVHSPSYHGVGMMPVAIPVIALGRNRHLAWGGTNMRNSISDFYDVSMLPTEQITETTEQIRTRLWRDIPFTVRRTPYGGIITDVRFIAKRLGDPQRELALRWTGNMPSDEITSMLDVMRSDTVQAGRQALGDFGSPSQNMVLGDTTGNIALVFATKHPIRNNLPRTRFVLDPQDPADQWTGLDDATSLPYVLNPPEGIIATSNNRPPVEGVNFGYAFSPPDRNARIEKLLLAEDTHDIASFQRIQLDVGSDVAVQLANKLLLLLTSAPEGEDDDQTLPPQLSPQAEELVAHMRNWDGNYAIDSLGATAFEHFIGAVAPRRYPAKPSLDWRYVSRYLVEDLLAMPLAARYALLEDSIEQAARRDVVPWGEIHTLRAQHYLGNVPIIGGRYRLDTYALAGSRQTINKSDHSIGGDDQKGFYGSQSRFITDLSAPDENYLILAGGNDGDFRSAAFNDQMPLFQRGAYLRIPLELEAIETAFAHEVVLKPLSKSK